MLRLGRRGSWERYAVLRDRLDGYDLRVDRCLFDREQEPLRVSRDDGCKYELVFGWTSDRQLAANLGQHGFLLPASSWVAKLAEAG